jgi:hypothetical protein
MPRMKANTSLLTLALAAATLGAGCASDSGIGPQSNTGRGAIGGAAAGAVLGGIVGHQSGEAGAGAAIGAAAGGLAGAAIGNQRDRRQEVANASTDTYGGGFRVQSVPPTPTSQPYEQIPQRPAGNAVWLPGHYAFNGNNYDWIPGRWEYPPAGATSWVPPTWQPQGNGYIYVRGHWQ